MIARCGIYWFRRDLRLDDHPVLTEAARTCETLLPVYIIDPREFGETRYGIPRVGGFRLEFLLQTLDDLRKSLVRLGSDLVVRVGETEAVLAELAEHHHATVLFASKEVCSEELAMEKRVSSAMSRAQVRVEYRWNSTLFHLDDLPFDQLRDMPDIFSNFRRAVEKRVRVRAALEVPSKLPPVPAGAPSGPLPDLRALGGEVPPRDDRGVLPFKGGWQVGLRRLDEYFWQRDALRVYKESRNGLLGADYSSKFSPWLSLGALSPRRIYQQVKEYEKKRVENESTYWLVFELLWRDFFRFVALKEGNKIFKAGGLRRRPRQDREDQTRFTQWARGETGFPFMDANMIELARTGWMSNRGRQNVASFLVRDLGVHWRMGAELFESLLVDYDPCSNWGNWNYVSGVGNDPREDRYFHVLKQAENYDPKGDFVRHWIPQLAGLKDGRVHEPWTLGKDDLRAAGVSLGGNYPKRIVQLSTGVGTR
jgi:deoxyribodipyrimidine photo-lyase